MDLSKAYDCLDHSILLNKLESYRIRGVNLKLFRSYLQGRYQQVEIYKQGSIHTSSYECITKGVPQGSVLGPLLFIIYINDLSGAVCRVDQSVLCYADDTSLLVSGRSIEEVTTSADSILERTEEWMLENHLIVNETKTNFILFKTKQSSVVSPGVLQLRDKNISISSGTRFLGVVIDENISWSMHITDIVKRLSKVCYSIRFLSRYLETGALQTVYYANFYSTIKYSILNWGGCNELNKVFVVQKRVIRIIYKLQLNASCRGVFKENKLLTVVAIYIRECLLYMFKNQYKFDGYQSSHMYNTRSINYFYPIHNLTTFEKSPLYRAIKFHNKIPNNLKTLTTFRLFKAGVTEYLMYLEPYSLDEFFNA